MKQILYVDKYCTLGEDSRTQEENRIRILQISRILEKEFSLDFHANLSEKVLEALKQKSYQGLVSHFPYEDGFLWNPQNQKLAKEQFYRGLYEISYGLFKKIRADNSDLVMIAYTGASSGRNDVTRIMTQIILETGAEGVVFKSREAEADAKSIIEKLKVKLG